MLSCSSHLHHPPVPPAIVMDSSPVLRKQNQNKICSDFKIVKKEHNRMQVDPKPSKHLSVRQLSEQDRENKDPGNSEMARKSPVRTSVSRLPVLAKTLCPQTPYDFSQSHCRWQEKPLAGKAKKKKTCTRPVPFNFSQPKSTRTTSKNLQPLNVSQSRTSQHEGSVCKSRLKTQKLNTKPSKHPALLHSNWDSTLKTHEKATVNQVHPLEQSGSVSTFRTSTNLSSPLLSSSNNVMHQSSAPSAETCLVNMNLLSLKDPSKSALAGKSLKQTTQGNFSSSSTDKGENFQPDHAALLSILQNEGVGATGRCPVTPQSKLYNCLPQRVSVMKSRQKAGPSTVKSVQFSPEVATPRPSVCLPVRGSSACTPQRVPVRKTQAEPTAGRVAVELKETPLKKSTAQRVCNTRHQPMFDVERHLSLYASTPGLRSRTINTRPHQEQEVVQRLFDDEEEEQSTNVTQTEQTTTHCEENVDKSKANTSEDEEQEQRIMVQQPFFQGESIIFSMGKKLFRATPLEKQESSPHQSQHGPVSSEQRKTPPMYGEITSVATCHIKASAPSLHRDLIVQKSGALSSAAALLRKRLLPLEELRLDEEVATYTSVSVPVAPGFVPPRARCGNPLASILHFEESTKFVPVISDLVSGPSSLHSSALQER
uniref:uncharacterized protein troap isoform X1 n=1 Tax=Monopterus albus TaxID=43700 RepID=UPI0009B43712|nr:uncharacterized protein LOC109971829 isoform X1 [Monopterus albus]XP_020475994.1 uncharacterized protein LOC109971829 isoform X2 [Monopterus albus]